MISISIGFQNQLLLIGRLNWLILIDFWYWFLLINYLLSFFFIKTTFSFSHFHSCHGFSSSLIALSSKTIFSINNQWFDGKSATKVMSAGIIQSLNFKIVVLPVKLNLAGLTFCIFDSPFLRILQREVCSSSK